MNYPKTKKIIFTSISKKNKIFKNKFNKRRTKLTLWKLQRVAERNFGRPNKWKVILCLWTRWLTVVKIVVTPKMDPQIQFNPFQNPNRLFPHQNWQDEYIYMKIQGSRIGNTNLKKNKVGRLKPIKKLTTKLVIKAVWYWHKDK